MVKHKQNYSNPLNILLVTAVGSTLIINPNFADPFNAPKMYFLMIGGMFLFCSIIFSNVDVVRNFKIFFLIILFFILSLLLSFIFTDQKFIGLAGDSLRQMGLLTYLSLTIVMIYSTVKFKLTHFQKLIPFLTVFIYIIIIYGFMQEFEKDPFKWVNQYDPMILTLGNPNYSGSFLAIFAVLFLGIAKINSSNVRISFFYFITSLILVFLIIRTSARQGLISLMFGLMIYFALVLFIKRKIYGLLISFLFFVLSTFVVAGIMQIGPLAQYLYKESVSLRGYYWRAGIDMFRENFFTGVGLDRYGAYFKFYREANYSRIYGYEITSSNAHNSFIQFFATGGIFLGLAYFTLVVFIAVTGLRAVLNKNISRENRFTLIAFFAAWSVFISQSVVSIDNIGLSIWGWVIGGFIIGLSRESSLAIPYKLNITSAKLQENPAKLPITGLLVIGVALTSLFFSRGETKVMYLRNQLNSGAVVTSVYPTIESVTSDSFTNPFYKFEIANYLLQANDLRGLKILENLVSSDPATPHYLNSLSMVYEAQRRFEDALQTRLNLEKVDPFNATNLLQIARLYKNLEQKPQALEYKRLVVTFVPGSEISKTAEQEIVFN